MKKQNRRVYLSKYYPEGLPSNCVLNKVATGCGGTSLEIENMNRDSIITVPSKEIVTEKPEQYPNDRTPNDFILFGVQEGVSKEDVIEYLKNNKVHKIIVVYDSLYKVIDAITELGKRNLKDYFLLIDEIHYVANNYQFRKPAMKRVLSVYKMFDKWCFMTATPTDEEFTLEELKGIRIEVAPFKIEEVNIKNVKTPQVEATTKKLIDDYIENRLQNAHIFVNSVEIIASLIKACGLTNDNCKVVWGEGNKSYKNSIQGIKRSKVGDTAKKINFYTSCSYEGCDVFDEEGQYIIVSDGRKAHTQMDISTSFRQILGRIRNTKYRSEAVHIFKQTRYSETANYEKYKEFTIKQENESLMLVDAFNKCEITQFKEEELNDKYITKEDGVYVLDRNLITCDLRKYKISMHTYGNIAILSEEQEKAGFKTVNLLHQIEPSDFLKRNKDAKVNFKDSFTEYSELRADIFTTLLNPISENRINLIEQAYGTIKDAFNILGTEEVKKLKYNQTSIKRKLIALSDKSNSNKIARILNKSGIKSNEFIPLVDAKNKLKEAYKLVKIDKQPKASDLNNYYMTESLSKRLNGEMVHGLKIIREKFIFN